MKRWLLISVLVAVVVVLILGSFLAGVLATTGFLAEYEADLDERAVVFFERVESGKIAIDQPAREVGAGLLPGNFEIDGSVMIDGAFWGVSVVEVGSCPRKTALLYADGDGRLYAMQLLHVPEHEARWAFCDVERLAVYLEHAP